MIEIVSAYYGLVGSTKDRGDVTSNIKKLVSSDKNTLSLIVSPTNIGVNDPAPGNPKQLDIQYTIDNDKKEQSVTDGSTLLIQSQGKVPQSWTWFTISSITNIWYQAMIVVGVFFYIMSVRFSMEFGKTFLNPIVWLLVGLLLPGVSFWGLPILIIIMRIFSPYDFLVLQGGRR